MYWTSRNGHVKLPRKGGRDARHHSGQFHARTGIRLLSKTVGWILKPFRHGKGIENTENFPLGMCNEA
jgi:hypothetical protein